MPRPRLLTPLFGLVMLSTLAYFLAVGALIPSVPRYVKGPLGGGSIAVGAATGGFHFLAVLVRPFAGRLADRRGRRLLIVAGGGIVALTVLCYIPADSVAELVGLRVLGGVGEALFFVGGASVIQDLAPDARRAEAFSYYTLALHGGIALGPLTGEVVLGRWGFDAVWALCAGAAALAAVLALPIPETRPDREDAAQQRIVHPAGVGPGLVNLTAVWGVAAFNSFVPLYVFDLGLAGSAPVFGLYSGLMLAVRSLGGWIPDRLGPARTAKGAMVSSIVGLAVLAGVASPLGLFGGTALFALGQSLLFPSLMTMALNAAPASERASVVGTFTAFFDLAFGAGALSAGAVASVLGFRGAFAASAAVAVCGYALLLARVGRFRPTAYTAPAPGVQPPA